MKPIVFYTINEGLFFWNGQHGLMLDYLFDNTVPAWSDLPDLTHQHMLGHAGEFSRNHTLLFTHSHPDHYSRRYTQEYTAQYISHIYGPGVPESTLTPRPLEPGVSTLRLPGYRVLILSTRHQGGDEPPMGNTMLCLETEGSWYLHLGDSILTGELLQTLARYGVAAPEAIFSNYYHIVPKRQRELLIQLHGQHTFAIHFPFPEDDAYNIRHRLTRFLSNAREPFLQDVVMPESMSRIL